MPFMCPIHKKVIEGKLNKQVNTKHKCIKCEGTGRKCLTGYNAYLAWSKAQEEGSEINAR